jgi:hypothetical protein
MLEMMINDGGGIRYEPFSRDKAIKWLTNNLHGNGFGLKDITAVASIDDIEDDFSSSSNPFQFLRPYVWINWNWAFEGKLQVALAIDDASRSIDDYYINDDDVEQAVDLAIKLANEVAG